MRMTASADDDGRTVFTVDRGSELHEPTVYRRFDVASGAILAQRSGRPAWFWGEQPACDRRFGRLFVGDRSTVLALDATTLAEIGRVEGPAPELFWSIVLDPERPEAYVAWWRYSEERYRQTVLISRISTETLAILASLHMPVDGRVIGLALGPRPPALSDLNVVVDQRLATLTGRLLPAGRSRPASSSKPDSLPVQPRCDCLSRSAPRASPSPVWRPGVTTCASGP